MASKRLAVNLMTIPAGPFQFSLHLEQADGAITHHEFFSLDCADPRRACAEALFATIPVEATVIAYNASLERSVLRDLAAFCPDLTTPLDAMAARSVNLLPVARATWCHRDHRGSLSIKAVLPTLSSLDYASLEGKDSSNAQLAWLGAADLA